MKNKKLGSMITRAVEIAGIIASIMAITVSCVSSSAVDEPIPHAETFGENTITGRLPNGVPYYIRRNSIPEKQIHMRLLVKTGSFHEKQDEQGLGHIVRHMNFLTTENFIYSEIDEYLASLNMEYGAEKNSVTDLFYTNYFIDVNTDNDEQIITGIRLLQDWARGPVIDPRQLEGEKDLIAMEFNTRRQSRNNLVAALQWNAKYNNSPYENKDPMGSMEQIRQFEMVDIYRFVEEHYTSDTISIVIAGDIDPLEMEKFLIDIFIADLPSNNRAPREEYPFIKQNDRNHYKIYSGIDGIKPSIIMWKYTDEYPVKGFTKIESDYCASIALQTINRRLEMLAAEPESQIMTAKASWIMHVKGQRFLQYFLMSQGDLETAYVSFCTAIQELYENGITASEFSSARQQWQGTTMWLADFIAKAHNSQIADFISSTLSQDAEYLLSDEYLKKRNTVEDVPIESIQYWITEFLRPEYARNFVIIGEGMEYITPEFLDSIKEDIFSAGSK